MGNPVVVSTQDSSRGDVISAPLQAVHINTRAASDGLY